tara:strand:- start:105 stop:1922 length:1818 start_codon:yes stop_codon:yes gene_type:complete
MTLASSSELLAHPAFGLLFFGLAAAVLRGRFAAVAMIVGPIFGFWLVSKLELGSSFTCSLFGFEMVFAKVDQQAILFGYLFHLAALIVGVYSFHLRDPWQMSMGMFYAACAVGVAFAGDLLSLFLWWEGLALTSVFQIWAKKTQRAEQAGFRYLFFHVLSGLLLLAGIIFRYHEVGGENAFAMVSMTMAFEDGDLYAQLILFAIGIKCAFPFFHVWLTDGYPEATPTGAVFLSAFTSKAAICIMARLFVGTDFLITVGAVMAMFPIFYAVIENDLRRVLGYSMINQIGFMVVGIGIGTPLAVDGALAHAFNDVLFKGLLFMAMGAVLYRTGEIRGSELGGLYRTMPWTTGLCIIGAASISAFPLFSGFVSKSIIMVEAARGNHYIVWLCLLFASAGVFHHAGIKIPFFAFFAHDSGRRPKEAPLNMLIAMGIAAFMCLFIGCNPQWLYAMLPGGAAGYHPYDATHVITQTEILLFSALAFTLLNLWKLYPPELKSVNLDVDFFYRKAGRFFLAAMAAFWNPINEKAHAFFVGGLTAKLGAFTAHAPAVFLRWFVRPLRALGFFPDKTEDETVAALEERGDLGIHPVGLTALLGLTGFLVFLLLAR